jgi:hypothetical protein
VTGTSAWGEWGGKEEAKRRAGERDAHPRDNSWQNVTNVCLHILPVWYTYCLCKGVLGATRADAPSRVIDCSPFSILALLACTARRPLLRNTARLAGTAAPPAFFFPLPPHTDAGPPAPPSLAHARMRARGGCAVCALQMVQTLGISINRWRPYPWLAFLIHGRHSNPKQATCRLAAGAEDARV